MRIAVIDLGTNTFNLLIVETGENGKYSILINEKLPVKLGAGGIGKRVITPEAAYRGINALVQHKNTIEKHGVDQIHAFATSAIRSADNGREYAERIKQALGISMEIITGEKEAELIFKGISQSVPLGDEKVLVLDIGGGSNELIIGNKNKIYWKKSFNLGIARLLEQFEPSDPMTQGEINLVESFLGTELHPLIEAVSEHQPSTLVGASGSFDTFHSMIGIANPEAIKNISSSAVSINMQSFNDLHARLIASTFEERKHMKGLEPMRIEMIVLAAIFTKFTLEKCNIQRLIQSDYALKEGVIKDLIVSYT